ncbi:hypothetical protein DXG01_014965 [Tephrocybe rancida]|nr:hypothetical protein DXG01_014965 [Tephrocybe rancida]
MSSYREAYKSLFRVHARDMIQEGYAKYRGHAFKIPGISRWMVVISGNQMVDELCKAPDDQISFLEAAADSIQAIYTMGEVHFDPYHNDVVKSSLTRSLVERFPDVQEEIIEAFKEFIPATEGRNSDYRDLNIEFTVDVMNASRTINLFPNFLKPLAGRYFTNIESQVTRAMNHLRPMIEDRLVKEAEYGNDWSGRPVSTRLCIRATRISHTQNENDALSWLLNLAQGHQRSVRDLTMRILSLNFAAIHTTSIAFTQILFDLAAYPSFVPGLREEVETAISEDSGYSKISLHKMVKLDSFIKESQRLGGNGALSMMRKVLKDFTFSDGTTVPKGHTIAVANFSIHHDEKNYSDPSVFDGFRFSKLREQQAEGFSKHQMVALNHDYIVFGHGKHACPGRFFAVDELKALLAYVLLNYDVSFENYGPRPADPWFGINIAPDPKVSVMFRKRRA